MAGQGVRLENMVFQELEDVEDVVAAVIHGIVLRTCDDSCKLISKSRTEFTTEYYTDSDGNRQSRQVPHYRSNPGGRRGRDGRDGSAPTWTLSAGPNGRNGSARINVEDSAGTAKSYANRYHLVVKSFEVVDENNDGIYEPGEYLIVKNIIVHNQGMQPS